MKLWRSYIDVDLDTWHAGRAQSRQVSAHLLDDRTSYQLEHALIARFGTMGRVPTPPQLRSDNGLVFTSRRYTALVRSHGLQQEFITPYCPQQNGMVERVIRTLKEQCVRRHRFETIQNASRVIDTLVSLHA